MSTLTNSATFTATLNAGQSSWLYITRGTTVVVDQGVVELKARLYQTDTLIPLVIRVAANQSSKIEFSQIYEIASFTNARIKLVAPTNLRIQFFKSKKLLSIVWRCLKQYSKVESRKREWL